MSDRQLFYIPDHVSGEFIRNMVDQMRRGNLVEAKPCVHGNYAAHVIITSVRILDNKSLWDWCDGKPKAD